VRVLVGSSSRAPRHRQVDKIKRTAAAAGPPRISPAIKIELLSDRTQTLRAAVRSVQFTCFDHRDGR